MGNLLADLRPGRRIKLQFRGVSARPWLLERRNGFLRGIYNRLVGDNRFVNTTIFSGVRWCLNAMPSASGFSAYQMAFGSDPVGLFGGEDGDDDLKFAQDTSSACRFAQQRELRMRA